MIIEFRYYISYADVKTGIEKGLYINSDITTLHINLSSCLSIDTSSTVDFDPTVTANLISLTLTFGVEMTAADAKLSNLFIPASINLLTNSNLDIQLNFESLTFSNDVETEFVNNFSNVTVGKSLEIIFQDSQDTTRSGLTLNDFISLLTLNSDTRSDTVVANYGQCTSSFDLSTSTSSDFYTCLWNTDADLTLVAQDNGKDCTQNYVQVTNSFTGPQYIYKVEDQAGSIDFSTAIYDQETNQILLPADILPADTQVDLIVSVNVDDQDSNVELYTKNVSITVSECCPASDQQRIEGTEECECTNEFFILNEENVCELNCSSTQYKNSETTCANCPTNEIQSSSDETQCECPINDGFEVNQSGDCIVFVEEEQENDDDDNSGDEQNNNNDDENINDNDNDNQTIQINSINSAQILVLFNCVFFGLIAFLI